MTLDEAIEEMELITKPIMHKFPFVGQLTFKMAIESMYRLQVRRLENPLLKDALLLDETKE